jgi:hypothetical protein
MIKISNGILALSVDEKGAQMRSLIDERTGREYLWQADPAIWGRTAPILFPAVGKMHKDSYLHGGKSYPMPKHGFLRDAELAPEILSEDYLVLAYSPDEKIKESYPFDFEFLAKFALDGSALVFAYEVENKGAETMDTAAICTGMLGFMVPSSVNESARKPLVIKRCASSLATSLGHTYVFHEPIIYKMVIEMSVGSAKGIITRHKYFKSDVPSTFAAKYSSLGICIKFCFNR